MLQAHAVATATAGQNWVGAANLARAPRTFALCKRRDRWRTKSRQPLFNKSVVRRPSAVGSWRSGACVNKQRSWRRHRFARCCVCVCVCVLINSPIFANMFAEPACANVMRCDNKFITASVCSACINLCALTIYIRQS